MPSIVAEQSIAAGGNNTNLFTGSVYEIATRNRVVSIGVTAAATGTFAQLQSGSDVIAEEFSPIVRAAMPVVPDDFYFNDVMGIGDRLRLSVRNPTGGAVILRAVANMTDL